MTSAPVCIRCGRPTLDGYVCTAETDRARAQLAELADMTPAARDIATGQASHSHGGGTGKPGSRLPFDLGATARLDAVQAELTTWARHVAEERGAHFVSSTFQGHRVADPITEAASWLSEQMEWLRHRPEVDEALTTIEACARVVRGLARGPSAQRFLGPCGAPAQVDVSNLRAGEPPGTAYVDGAPCDGDVYARDGAQRGRCRTCGAEVATDARRAWLDDEVRAHAFRAAHIADAYGINVKTIRSWAARGQLKSYWRTGTGLTVEWVDPEFDGLDADERAKREAARDAARGPRLHYVGDVLDLAAGDAARRETMRADRARRAAARAADDERLNA